MIKVGSAAVVTGRIDLPLRGRWTAELVLATATLPSGAVAIECIGGLSLPGVVTDALVWHDSAQVRIVGGRGNPSATLATAHASGLVRDPLGAIANAGGETLDSTISASVSGLPLERWDVAGDVPASLTALAREAERQLGERVDWRFLPAGTLWLGAETWPAMTLPEGDAVMDALAFVHHHMIAAATPTVLPGYDLSGVGKVRHVTHWIGREIRTDVTLWT